MMSLSMITSSARSFVLASTSARALVLRPSADAAREAADRRPSSWACARAAHGVTPYLTALGRLFWRTKLSRKSRATRFWPPSGMMMSAKRLDGSTKARCIGRTLS